LKRLYFGYPLLLIWLAACSTAPKPPAVEPLPLIDLSPKPAPFISPLPGGKISSGFANYVLKSRGRKHHGIDLTAPTGTPVYAASYGVVKSADNRSMGKGFGNAVFIEHNDQLSSLSAHLSRIDVQAGDVVQVGQQIGLVGKTGRATGPHLHFELWVAGVPHDPQTYLPAMLTTLSLQAP